MNKGLIKVFLKTLALRVLKLGAIALPFFAIIFFIFFMKHADEEGLEAYYKITHLTPDYRKWFRQRSPKIMGYAVNPDSIYFCWGVPKSRFLSSVKIERAIKEENQFQIVTKIPKNQDYFKDTNISLGTSYIYRVEVCYYLFCSHSYPIEFRTYNPPPPAPSDLEAVVVSPYQIDLRWKDNSDYEQRFEIENGINGKWIKIGQAGPNQTTFSLCPVNPGISYQYRVRAFDGHFYSEDNPIVFITTPDLEKEGEIHPLEKYLKIHSLIWNGKEWATAYSEATQDDPLTKEDEWKINTEIYFQRLDSDFKAIGEKARISFDPCESEGPSLAWNGKEYGAVWSDSRVSKPWCYSGGDSSPPKEVFFARISAEGKRIGSEVRLLSEFDYRPVQRLFWQKDHYDLFYAGPTDITYLKLDLNGKILNQPVPAGESTYLWDMIQAGDHYGITWISSGSLNSKILYFLDFDPESKSEIKPIKLARDSCEEPACLNLDYTIAAPSVLWTGSHLGVCYKNCRTDTVLALVNPKTKQYQTLIVMHMRSYQCTSKNFDARGECAERLNGPDGDLQMQSAQCLWNGSEIAVFSTTVAGFGANAALARFSPEGKPIDQVRLLPISGQIAWLPLPKLYWHQDHYFTFYEDSLILIKP